MRRYSRGVIFLISMKQRLNHDMLLKPTEKQMSVIGMSVFCSRSQASQLASRTGSR